MSQTLIAFIASVSLLLSTISSECGYNACHKTDPKKLNIHIIPHSHDDIGYHFTADLYAQLYTNVMFEKVVESLQVDPNRTFTQVEMYFFNRWWREQNETTKDTFRQLVRNGQLVFTNGGWSVNDEGTAHYNDIIDQMTLGLKFLHDEFGTCGVPKVSWQIDPFGHSREVASLYAMMAFDGHFINRGVHPKGEFVWKASDDLNTRIFSTVLHKHYGPPEEMFEFEDPKNAVNESNKGEKVEKLLNYSRQWNSDFGDTNQVLMPMGGDFRYVYSEHWYASIDMMITEIRERHPEVDIFYSTPNCYIKAVNELNITYEERDVDYLNYWTGYYTSRPALKYNNRINNNILQAAKQLDVMSRLDTSRSHMGLDEARNEQAVMTHHDAITGTAPQNVEEDYTSRMYSGYIAGQNVIRNAFEFLMSKNESKMNVKNNMFCDSLNITECHFTETHDKIAVTVYNPIARPVSQYLSIPVVSKDYDVYDSEGQVVNETAVFEVSEGVKYLPERDSNATNELLFRANIPALGFTTYFIEKQQKANGKTFSDEIQSNEMKGKSFSLQIDENSGSLKTITVNGKAYKLNQSFKYYESMGGKDGFEDSGSYNFCPNGEARDLSLEKHFSRHTSGSVHELKQQFSQYIQQTVRTYENEDYIEFDWTVGSIPIDDGIGREVITRFETDLKTDGVFYTDANGRQTIKRHFTNNSIICNNNTISGNYYPIYSRMFVRDEHQDIQMTLLNDRTQGGSALSDGSIELMVHRRLTHNGEGGNFKIDEPGVDGKGLIIRGKHYLFFQPIAPSAQLHRELSQRLFMAPILSFESYTTREEYSSDRVISYSSLSHSMPQNIHLLTLENWRSNQVLIRLEHMYESTDSNELSKGVDIDLKDMFKGLKIIDSVETNLVANELLSEIKQLKWFSKNEKQMTTMSANNLTVRLTPQQIRTFVLTIENNEHKEDNCSVKWINTTQDTIPSDAYVGGYDESMNSLYICRHSFNEELIAGKANKHLGCVLTSDGNEVQITNETFEVLVGKGVQWVQRHGTDPISTHALVVGQSHNANTYIGRLFAYNSQLIGKVVNKMNYGFNGTEYSVIGNHEILVCV